MLTIERERKNRTTLIELKSATSIQQKNNHLQKLGGSIKASIDKLKRLRASIQAESDVRRIASMMADYQKENNYYNQLQQSLAEIKEDSELCARIKKMNRQFIQSYDPAELTKKFDYMKAQRKEHLKTEGQVEMGAINEEQLSGQLLASDKHRIWERILEQEKSELVQLQRLIKQVKDIATTTSIMINKQGENLELSLQKMKSANLKLREGKELMQQTNEYQQDTTKKHLCFCFVLTVVVVIVLLIVYSANK